MPIVAGVVSSPAGGSRGSVRIELVGTNGAPIIGYTAGGEIVAPYQAQTDDTGEWSATLIAQLDITPAGTAYLVTEQGMGGPEHRSYINMPDTGGPYTVLELLTSVPGAIAGGFVTQAQLDAVAATIPNTEAIQDLVGALLAAGANVTVTYDDPSGSITVAASGGGFTQEQIEDFVGAMTAGNTETGVTVTYDDATGKLDFVIAVDAAAGTGSLRTLGTGATQAAAGNHNHDAAYVNDVATVAHGNTGATETITLTERTGEHHTANLDANCVFTLPSAATKGDFFLQLTRNATQTFTDGATSLSGSAVLSGTGPFFFAYFTSGNGTWYRSQLGLSATPITVSTTAPSSPATNDVWIDTT